MNPWLYSLPALPLVARLLIAVRFSGYMCEELKEATMDRSGHRTLLTALASISFAGLLGLVALPGALEDRQLAIWYMLTSFLALLASINLQGYKAQRWHDLLGDSLTESATLSLLASVSTFILGSTLSFEYQAACFMLAAAVWSSDFILRVRFTMDHLDGKETADGLK